MPSIRSCSKHQQGHTSGVSALKFSGKLNVHVLTHLFVVEGFGMNGEAAQLYRLLEARGDVQLLELLVRVPRELIRTEQSTLLGQRI